MDELDMETGAGGRDVQEIPADYEYNTLMRLLRVSVSKHLLDEHFTLIWANEFYYQLIGWEKEEYEARFHNRPDLYYKNDQAEWKELSDCVAEAISSHKNGYQILSRIRRKNGEFIWVQFSTRFADEYIHGSQVAYTVMTNVDKVIRMQKEQSVTYENLPGFAAKYKIENTGGGLKAILLDANSRFMECFGERGGGEGCPLYWQNLEDKIEGLRGQKKNIMAGNPLRFVMQVHSRKGHALWLQVNAACVDWQGGSPIYLVVFTDITDVTELREMQKKLQRQTEALKDALTVAEYANKAKSEFLSRMSHEIRTPMNAIIGMTTIAGAYIEDRQRVADCLGKIGYASKHLMSLINDVLDMSKIDEGKMQISHSTFNLETVAESITSIIYPQAVSKGLTFTMPLVGITETVLAGDSLRLNQVLLNLLSNALKFTPAGGSVYLEIRQMRRSARRVSLRFTVSDTGIGMSEAFLERIFMPFEQESVDTGQKFGGTGLGMAICKNLVSLMGGTISVKSEIGKGTAFEIELDFDIPEESCNLYKDKQHNLDSLKVLVTDNDKDSCIHVSLLLKNLGIHSEWVQSGSECVEKVRSAHETGEEYDVCFIDLKMPDMDGIQAARRIRELVGADTTIIIITAYDWSAIEQDAKEAGVNTFLPKPVFASTLYNTLLAAAGVRKMVSPWSGVTVHSTELGGRNVLLAEDNELNREIAVELLKMAGITTDYAVNGKEALMKFIDNGNSYDLILMDVQMPVMDGYEATRAIRNCAHPRARTIPIIAMTADAFHEDIVKASAAGMNGHLAKPIDPDLLYSTLAKMLEKN